MSKSEKSNQISEIYCKSLLSRKIYLNYSDIDKDIVTTLENKLKQQYEGKCCNEGYIKIGSIQVISYSTGELSSDKIIYTFSGTFGYILHIHSNGVILKSNS